VGRRPGGPGGHGRRSIHRAFCSPIGLSELGFAHDSRPTVRDDPHLSVLFVKIRTFTAVLWSVRFRVRFGSASLPRDGDRKPPPPPARLPRHAARPVPSALPRPRRHGGPAPVPCRLPSPGRRSPRSVLRRGGLDG